MNTSTIIVIIPVGLGSAVSSFDADDPDARAGLGFGFCQRPSDGNIQFTIVLVCCCAPRLAPGCCGPLSDLMCCDFHVCAPEVV